MKEFVEKLIERLEERKAKAKQCEATGIECGIALAIEIVNQLSEEYNATLYAKQENFVIISF